MTNLNQIWVPIKDFPNYEINIIGEVRRINNSTRGKAGYLLKSFIHTKGYKSIRLRNKGLSKTFRIHRLVAEAYLPNPKQMPQVNHINGIKTDNHISNLEWCDNSYNQRHSYNVLNKRPGMVDELLQRKLQRVRTHPIQKRDEVLEQRNERKIFKRSR